MLSNSDVNRILAKGITIQKINEQLNYFKQGFPYLKLKATASTQKGIQYISEANQKVYIGKWSDYLETGKTVVKFVPASGAASRMFKDLFGFLAAEYSNPTTLSECEFFAGIHRFAFFDPLNQFCIFNEGKTIHELITEGNYKAIVENLLFDKGLNYGSLPKGLILFFPYPQGARTAMEEHWVEGALYACDKSRKVHLHFTVSPDYKNLFEDLTRSKLPEYAQEYNVEYQIDFSEQKKSTDTIAVNADNTLFRKNGELVFRPGGHGALIENLNEINADIVFIKNIDNVVPDSLKSITVQYKELLAGILVDYQEKMFDYLMLIDSGKYTHDQLLEMLYFLQNELCIKNLETKVLEDVELVLYIKSKLNRPLRVCGMVRNTGEPGGGPFLVYNPDGTISLQILESTQIDLTDPETRALFEEGTHFNPVDLICSLRDYQGNKFNLLEYVDKNSGFISSKSKDGRELKALELPGLWNGAMSDWNTVFVEVLIETFNPIKSVNDLLVVSD